MPTSEAIEKLLAARLASDVMGVPQATLIRATGSLSAADSEPSLHEARQFGDAIHARFPGNLLAYNCSPSFNWKKKLDDHTIEQFQRKLGRMRYKFQFVTRPASTL